MATNLLTQGDIIEASKALKGLSGNLVQPNYKRVSVGYHDFLAGIDDDDLRETTAINFAKAIGSTDVEGYRITSMVPATDVLRNDTTVFLNIAEMNTPFTATDIHFKFRERKVGTDKPVFFNIDGALPAGRQSNRTWRWNQIGFGGNLLDIKYSAQTLAQGADVVAEELADEYALLRRFISEKLLSNEGVTSELSPTGTEPEGFVDRSILNVSAIGPNADLTNPIIQGRIDAIANATSNQGLSYKLPLVALCRAGQIAKIRDLMIARYPGETSQSYAATMAQLTSRLANVALPLDTMAIYKPDPGRPVIFINDEQLPSGTCIFFDPTRIKLAKFAMFGQTGPWTLERPTSALTTLTLVWDAFSLVDYLVESRAVITGLND